MRISKMEILSENVMIKNPRNGIFPAGWVNISQGEILPG
jgi:hypothetical protein